MLNNKGEGSLKKEKKKSFIIQSLKDKHSNVLVYSVALLQLALHQYTQLVACFLTYIMLWMLDI